MKYLFYLVVIIVLFSSCGKQPIEQFKTIQDRIWEYNTPADFVVNIAKPGTYYMQVQVRYSQEYSYSNVWLVVNEKSPDGTKTNMRLNIPLFDLGGIPYGSFAGKFFDRSYPNPNPELENKKIIPVNFPAAGQYTFSLQHNMRIDKLDGIAEIGIRLKAAQ